MPEENQEDNDFLKKFQGEIKDEASFQEKTVFVENGLDTKKTGPVQKIWDKVQALWRYVRDPKIPWYKKTLPLAGLIYLVSPIDLIPDFIPVAGLLDDVGVIGLIFYQMGSMLGAIAIASAVVSMANLSAAIIDGWIDESKKKHIDATTIEILKEKLANGHYQIIGGIFNSDGEQIESKQWEAENIDPDLAERFGQEDKIVLDLTA